MKEWDDLANRLLREEVCDLPPRPGDWNKARAAIFVAMQRRGVHPIIAPLTGGGFRVLLKKRTEGYTVSWRKDANGAPARGKYPAIQAPHTIEIDLSSISSLEIE